jgi:hypothetical protein
MSKCPVCLETVFDPQTSAIVSQHLKQFLDHTFLAYAYASDREKAMSRYVKTADFKSLQKKLNIPPGIVQEWKQMADIGMDTIVPKCQHALHRKCMTQICMQAYSVEESSLPECHLAASFVALPKMPHWFLGQTHYMCPVCRNQQECPVSVEEAGYDECCTSKTTLGPYRLKKGALVWVYDRECQPGHPEAGSFGILQKSSGFKDCLVKLVAAPKNMVSEVVLPWRCVFDVGFLLTLGIPSREQVMQPDNVLYTEDLALADAEHAAQSSQDVRWMQQVKTRRQYVESVLSQKSHILKLLAQHCSSPNMSGVISKRLCGVAMDLVKKASSLETIWRCMIMPRLGLLGRFSKLLKPTLPEKPIPYALLEHLQKRTGYDMSWCNVVLRYASGGWAPSNTTSVQRILKQVDQIRKHPQNKALCDTFSFQLPLHLSQPQLEAWCSSLELYSEHEMARLKHWCSQQYLMVYHGTLYWVHPLATNLHSTSPSVEWMQRYTELVPDLHPEWTQTIQSKAQFYTLPEKDVPVLYQTVANVKQEIDALRETVAAYPVTITE